VFDMNSKRWVITEGDYEVRLATDVTTVIGKAKFRLQKQIL